MELAKLNIPDVTKSGLRTDEKIMMLVDCLSDFEKKARFALNNIEQDNLTDELLKSIAAGTGGTVQGGGNKETEVTWESIADKPEEFTPSYHTHTSANLNETLKASWTGLTTPGNIPVGITYVEVGSDGTSKGFPVGYATCIAVKITTTRCAQICVEKYSGNMWVRSSGDSVWGDWHSSTQMDLLWTNASPSSQFAAQTVSVSLTAYNAIAIEFSHYLNESTYMITCRKGAACKGAIMEGDTSNLCANTRNFKSSNTGITFEAGRFYNSNNSFSSETQNGRLVPLRIYGIKGVTV